MRAAAPPAEHSQALIHLIHRWPQPCYMHTCTAHHRPASWLLRRSRSGLRIFSAYMWSRSPTYVPAFSTTTGGPRPCKAWDCGQALAPHVWTQSTSPHRGTASHRTTWQTACGLLDVSAACLVVLHGRRQWQAADHTGKLLCIPHRQPDAGSQVAEESRMQIADCRMHIADCKHENTVMHRQPHMH